ncbi:hypothetical protein [Acutalibacter caecimuris]|uniref:hypothetical protein n=1 Tax=Acutalibacter caecimuris TaxID=3093657 RepID=UPI002AC8F6DB|nr:hypothetical protein [Acutalibacter sp. M00118]
MNRLDKALSRARALFKPPETLGPVILTPSPAGWTAAAHLTGKAGVFRREVTNHPDLSSARAHLQSYAGAEAAPVILLDVMG